MKNTCISSSPSKAGQTIRGYIAHHQKLTKDRTKIATELAKSK